MLAVDAAHRVTGIHLKRVGIEYVLAYLRRTSNDMTETGLSKGNELLRSQIPSQDPNGGDWITKAIGFAWDNVPFYRRLWERDGFTSPPALSACALWSVADIRADQEANPPYGTLYADFGIADVRWVVTSSGTTGVPRVTPHCASDLPNLRKIYKRFFEFAGVRSDDVAVNTFTYGPLAGCWSSTRACEEIGATVLPASNGRTTPPERLLTLVDRLGVTVVVGMPSYLAYVGRMAQETGVDLPSLSPHLLILAGEGATADTRRELTRLWGAETRSFYASSDVDWVAMECDDSARSAGELGAHVDPSQCHVEIVDPNGTPLPFGEPGELVVTTWARPSSPRIRYRTGDRSQLATDACECGRTSLRLLPISGRTDQSVRYRGVTVRLEEVERVLAAVAKRAVEFRVRHQRRSIGKDKDMLVVEIEGRPDELDRWQAGAIEAEIQRQLGVRPQVQLFPAGALVDLEDALGGVKSQRVREQ